MGTITDGHSEGKGAKEDVVDVPSSSEPSESSERGSTVGEAVVPVEVVSAELASRAEVGTHA